MSHVVSLSEVEFRDLDVIEKMCKRLGWTLKRGQKTFSNYGQWVGDTKAPLEFFTRKELEAWEKMDEYQRRMYMTQVMEKCDHAISVPGCAYEIGLVKKGDRYWPLWDYFSVGGLQNVLGQPGSDMVNPMPHAYAVEAVKQDAERQGWTWEETTGMNGKALVKVTCY